MSLMDSSNTALYSSLLERGRELHRLLLNARDWSKIDLHHQHHDPAKNLALYKRSSSNTGTQLPALKAVALVEGYSENLGAVLKSTKGRDWDTLFDQHELLARVDPETSITRYGMRPVRSSPRDFVLLTHSSTARSTHLHIAVSLPSNQQPVKAGYVRGHIDLLTWLIEPDSDEDCYSPTTSSCSYKHNFVSQHHSLLSTAPRLRVSCTLLLDPRHALYSSSYLTWLTSELPKSVALVCEYLGRRGFPPHISHWGSRVNIDGELWNEADEFEVSWSLNNSAIGKFGEPDNDSSRSVHNIHSAGHHPREDGNKTDTDTDDDSGVGYEDGSREIEVRLDARRWTGLEVTLKSTSSHRLLDPELIDVRQDHEGGIVIRAGWWSSHSTNNSNTNHPCILNCRRGVCNLGTVLVNGDLQDLSEFMSVSVQSCGGNGIGIRPGSSTWEEEIREALDSPMVGQLLSYPAQWERGMDMDALLSPSHNGSRRRRPGRPRAMSANHVVLSSSRSISSGGRWFPRFRRSPNSRATDGLESKDDLSTPLQSSSSSTAEDMLGDLASRGILTPSSSLRAKIMPRRFSLSSVLWRPNNNGSSSNQGERNESVVKQQGGSMPPPSDEQAEEVNDQDSVATELPESVIWAVPRETRRFYSVIEIIIVAMAALAAGVILRVLYKVFRFNSTLLLGRWRFPFPIENHVHDNAVAAAAMAQLVEGVNGGMLVGGMLPGG
ncbi:hypothetical protein SeLEV6574_g07613 [Synchytrium endobioticum]|uniref:START domain-containing protein n=1 Tax=Synchytrium endobioticum TaxID=286115 RepID=A0A507CHB2_9FUNG|nr:hypothetical protein SeLEV6574_g07613 [Synchytrium endobioticum]